MLKLLQGGKKYSIKELAEILEVTPRQVRKYKNDFEKAGIYIETVKGRFGGYYYDSGEKLFEITFDIKELNILEKMNLNINDQKYSDIEKIILNSIIEKVRGIVIYSKNNDFVDEESAREFYNLISKAIEHDNDINCK